jgi:hypothetical protein
MAAPRSLASSCSAIALRPCMKFLAQSQAVSVACIARTLVPGRSGARLLAIPQTWTSSRPVTLATARVLAATRRGYWSGRAERQTVRSLALAEIGQTAKALVLVGIDQKAKNLARAAKLQTGKCSAVVGTGQTVRLLERVASRTGRCWVERRKKRGRLWQRVGWLRRRARWMVENQRGRVLRLGWKSLRTIRRTQRVSKWLAVCLAV